MARKKSRPDPDDIGYEPIKIRVLMTETGYPAPSGAVRSCFKSAVRAPEDGWWWIFATPASARDIRRRGLHWVGTLTSTFAPVQDAAKIYDTDPAVVPVTGSMEWIELMLEETREREAGLLS